MHVSWCWYKVVTNEGDYRPVHRFAGEIDGSVAEGVMWRSGSFLKSGDEHHLAKRTTLDSIRAKTIHCNYRLVDGSNNRSRSTSIETSPL